jgi:hypothetical protein
MRLHAVSGQLQIVDGQEQDRTPIPGLLAQPAPGRAAHGRQRDVLFVHLTLSGALTENANLIQGLLQKISEGYFGRSGTVTAGLRRVIQDTNDRLLKMNLGGSGAPREGAITCAVLHDDELFIVQTGESLALLGHNFGVERVPARTPEHITPLGRSSGLDFRYFHQRLLPGDMLLMADPRIAHLPSHALSPALVDTELDLGLEELKEAIGANSGRMLLIEFTDEPVRTQPILPQPVPKRERITLPKQKAYPTVAVAASAQPVREGQSTAVPEINIDELGDAAEYTARRAASRSALGLSFLTGWTADLMLRLRPPAEESEDGHWLLPVLIAIVIPLVVAIVVGGVYLERGRVRQISQIRRAMSQSLVAAEAAGQNDELAREQYNQVMTLAAQAEELRPGDGGVAEMRETALIALDQLDGVTRLLAQPLFKLDRTVDLGVVALPEDSAAGIFTLDDADGSVNVHGTDESFTNLSDDDARELGFGGQAVGSHVVQDLVDIAWRPGIGQESSDGLAMLDVGGALVTYYPDTNETKSVILGLSSEWQGPVDMAQYLGRLYVLDPPASTIWKYYPQDDGFVVDPDERTLNIGVDLDLNHAIDIDLYSEDGSLLVVYDDGRIRFYDTRSGRVQWDENDLLDNGLATPLQKPVAAELVGKGLNASIYVLDAGNGRVIQISRLGTVLNQYRATDERGQDVFVGGTDLAIAEVPLRIFVTSGNQLFLAEQ